jgi:hypothetical protein
MTLLHRQSDKLNIQSGDFYFKTSSKTTNSEEQESKLDLKQSPSFSLVKFTEVSEERSASVFWGNQ